MRRPADARNERRLRLRQLGDLPAPLGVASDPDDRAGPDAHRRRRLVAKRASDELEAVAVDLGHLASASTALTSVGEALVTTAAMRPSPSPGVGEHLLQLRVALGGVVRQPDIRFRTPVAVAMIVIDHARRTPAYAASWSALRMVVWTVNPFV